MLLKCEFFKVICRKSFWLVVFFGFLINLLMFCNENLFTWMDDLSSRERLEQLSGVMPNTNSDMDEWLVHNDNILTAVSLLITSEASDFTYNRIRNSVESLYGYEIDERVLSQYHNHPQLVDKDIIYIDKLRDLLLHATNYNNYILQIDRSATNMKEVSIFADKDSFAFRNAIKTSMDFKGMDIIPLVVRDSNWIICVSTALFTDIILIVMSIWLCFHIFSYEIKNGTDSLIKCTVRGRLTVIFTKAATLVILVAGLVLLFYISMVLLSFFLLGEPIEILKIPIQSVPNFRNCNINLTVAQYLAIFLVGKILGISLFAVFSALIFQITRNVGLSYLLILVLLIIEYLFYTLIHPSSIFSVVKYLNIWGAIDIFSIISDYININTFNFPIGRLALTVVWGICVFIVTQLIIAIMYLKNFSVQVYPEFYSLIKTPVERSTSLFLHESFNLIISKKVGILLVCLMLIAVNEIISLQFYTNNETAAYLICAKNYAGELTQKKLESIALLKNEMSQSDVEIETLYEQLTDQALTSNSMLINMDKIATLVKSQKGIQQFFDQIEYLTALQLQGMSDVSIESKLSTDYIFNNKALFLQRGLIAVIVLIVSLSLLFCDDSVIEKQRLIKSTIYGKKKLFWEKYILGGLLTTIVFIILQIPTVINCFKIFRINQWFAPLQSIQMFSEHEWKISIVFYLLVTFILQLLLLLIIPSVLALLSQIIQKQILVMTVSATVFVVPIFLEMIGIASVELPTINSILLLTSYFAQKDFISKGLILIVSVTTVGIMATRVAFKKYTHLT